MFLEYQEERKYMVAHQLRTRGIRDPRVLEAFETVPRHLFVQPEDRSLAYEDHPLSIGYNQTISQPFIVAYMTQALGLNGSERVLEVGTGSGYQAAILSRLAREVHTIEMIEPLSLRAAHALAEIGAANVQLHVGDGSLGWNESAPYDAILVSAAAPRVPPALLAQLADLGRMILPVGARGDQNLELWTRAGDTFASETLLAVAFVPLRGQAGM
jgi:protein-L-isoaspartate(D-aspartate) O-methyltransferase